MGALSLLTVLLLVACSNSTPTITRTVSGDTTFVTISANYPDSIVVVNEVRIIWQSDELQNPGSLARMGDRLIVGDVARLDIVPLDGGATIMVGRRGEGPGEFAANVVVGVIGDTALVLDAHLNRMSWFALDGTFLGSRTWVPQVPYVNPVNGEALVGWHGGVMYVVEENVHADRPTQRAVVWRALVGDSSRMIGAWDDQRWKDLGQRLIAPVVIMGPRALVDVGEDGRIAHGDGTDYCVDVIRPDKPEVLRICRGGERLRPGSGFRNPDLSDLEPQRAAVVRAALAQQQIPDELPSYDALRFGWDGTLWVRLLAPEQAQSHPYVPSSEEQPGPTHRRWDIYAGDGTPLPSVELPASFDPLAVSADTAYGFATLETGEKVVAGVGW